MPESQQSIAAWAAETFGEPGSLARVAARVNEELAELLRAYTAGQPAEKIVEEAADTAIVLCRLGDRLGVDVGRALKQGDALSSAMSTQEAVLAAVGYMWGTLAYCIPLPVNERLAGMQVLRLSWLLHRIVRSLGAEIWLAIEAKMAINRKRVWNVDGSGHGYHVRSGEDVKHA